MTKQNLAWLQVSEATDDEGIYFEDSPELREIERKELREMGAPDTDEIEFVSILPEKRDASMIEAMVTPAFIRWAKSRRGEQDTEPVENGISNLVYYEDGDEGTTVVSYMDKEGGE